MKAIKKLLDTTTKKIVAIAILVILLTWVLLFFVATDMAIDLIKPLLWTFLVVAVVWLGIHFGVKAWRKRKRNEFDELVAAKEGIEDRRREWATWTDELEKQGIDRYELPFYLLVGEPQSGKSVLLHNSDLHFPFGQNRLSGVGGTRGCDWWFTEEAVILDLAGRLFTHEGGAVDRVEFEAFLQLLYEFRPLCPANGVILVVPCDSLLRDSEEESAAKATKVQNALLTLTTKLQAQLPVYLVLTKGDQIFGFAESVHRLDVERRHQMFGWSRPSEKIDTPFDLVEVTDGFTELVKRSRLLRAHMLAGARLPEALPEVDRLYAFPHELEGMQQNLETYLKRIFTASNITDRVFFRGLYLTSGLQNGVPIAKVCTQLFGQSGEADMRDLEALFSKQRAYFIKDLIRNRVFGERGLVRPTQGRVQQARRTSVVGYGVSGAVVLASLIFAFVYLLKGVDEQKQTIYGAAMTAGQVALDTPALPFPELLFRLQQIADAAEHEPDAYEKTFTDARSEFKELYCALFDARVLPLVKLTALDVVESKLTDPQGLRSHEELLQVCEALSTLLGDIDFSKGSTQDALLGVLEPFTSGRTTVEGGTQLTLASSFDIRSKYGDSGGLLVPLEAGAARLVRLARLGINEVEQCLEPGSPTQPGNELGYMLAWFGAEEARAELVNSRVLQSGVALEYSAMFSNSMHTLERIEDEELTSGTGGKSIAVKDVLLQSRPLSIDYRDRMIAFVREHDSASGLRDKWSRMDQLWPFVGKKFEGHEGTMNLSALGLHFGSEDFGQTMFQKSEAAIGGLTGEIVIGEHYVPYEDLDDPTGLLDLCDKTLPADLDGQLAGLADRLREIDTSTLGPITTGHVANVFMAQCIELAKIFQRDLRTPEEALRALDGGEANGDGARFSLELVEELTKLHETLEDLIENRGQENLKRDKLRAWQQHVEALLNQHLVAYGRSAAESLPPLPPEGDFSPETWSFLRTLGRASQLVLVAPQNNPVAATAGDVQRRVFFDQAQELQERWLARPSDVLAETGKTVQELSELAQKAQTLPNPASLALGDDLRAWSARLDSVLYDRLSGLAKEVARIWQPDLRGRSSLRQAAGEALTELETIDEKIRASERAGMGGLTTILAALQTGGPVMSWLDMPRSRAVLDELVQWKIPTSVQQVKSDPEWRDLRDSVEGFNNVNPADDGYGTYLAEEYADRFSKQGAAPEEPAINAGIRLVREIRDQFAANLRKEIKERYLLELGDLLDETRYRDLFDVLFWDPRQEPPQFRDSDVQDALARLLNGKRGDFVKLKQKFKLADEKGIGKEIFPEEAIADEEGWAPIHRFLEELQTFLLGDEEDSIRAASINFWLIPDTRQSGSIWNLDSIDRDQWRDNFYYPEDDSSDGLQKEIMGGSMGRLKVSNWRFDGGSSDRRMLFVWSAKPTQADAKADPDRFYHSVPSCLAPMLLAWSGRPEDEDELLIYRLSFIPSGTTTPAPMSIEFERPLPIRPPKP